MTTWWRSLEQAERRPDEFPEGASEPPDGISRRGMLQLLGASATLATLSACRRPVEAIVPYVDPPEEVIPGVPRAYATTMPMGARAWGLVVESHEGRPTKVEGNALHPSTRGASSVFTQASILDLYDPDRSHGVLQQGKPATWEELVAAWSGLRLAPGGADLGLLLAPFASPTMARLLAAFRARFPQARVAVWEPVGDEGEVEGLRPGSRTVVRPVLHLDRAAVIVSIDADLLLSDGDGVAQARGWAQGRRGPDRMSRMYVVESTHTITGVKADHRRALPPDEIPAFAHALEAAVVGGGASDPWIGAAAADLLAHRGSGLVVAGRRQPPWVHALVRRMNEVLGNAGSTVTYHDLPDATVSRTDDLMALVGALRARAIRALAVVGGNPAYDAPADLELAGLLRAVPTTVHLSHAVDETSKLCTWHVNRAHFLESWGDARWSDGTASVVQPLIAPLYGGRSDVEVLGLLATGQDRPGHDLVRETWAGMVDGEAGWRRVLHDGVLPQAPAVAAALPPSAPTSPSTPGTGLTLLFQPSAAVWDGRFANVAWLQELPDPLTKMTWDNPLLVSPATARELGVGNEDVVRVEAGGRALEMPVWIVPGQADRTLVATLGYGRRAAGRVGTGVGFDTYALRTSATPWIVPGVTVRRTGATYPLAQTQDHGRMEGRDIVREGTPGHLPHGEGHAIPEAPPLWDHPDYDEGHQWGMSIDLASCVGCNACVVACQSENNIPSVGKEQVRKGREMHWIRVDRYFTGEAASPRAVFQPVPCMHCETAPCEQVCPVAATVHDAEGLNAMVYNRCIGTRYCSNNCPYKVRRFNFFHFTKNRPEIVALAQNPDVTVRSRGVMEKCTYCVQRINAARLDARMAGRPLRDGDVETACQQACPAQAIVFGDLRDGASRVVQAKKQERSYAMLAELNTRPRTTYLASLRNPNPALEGHPEGEA